MGRDEPEVGQSLEEQKPEVRIEVSTPGETEAFGRREFFRSAAGAAALSASDFSTTPAERLVRPR